MQVPDYVRSYRELLAQFIQTYGREGAMEWIVGGQYAQIGILESSALRTLGLQPEHTLIDVGCGSGRLPNALKHYLAGKFIGTDILEEALAFAKEKCGRADWQFIAGHEPVVPADDAVADYVSFFSVFTHLLDEDIYRFLGEAKRVLKPGGMVVFSFLDFECETHWPVFESTIADRNPSRVLNKFISKGAIRRWCRQLGMQEHAIYEGNARWIQLTEPFTYADGRRAEGIVEFGQSIAVLKKA
jgi:ubiquinone/menaquinone biosynthesis C-methylase UbiE